MISAQRQTYPEQQAMRPASTCSRLVGCVVDLVVVILAVAFVVRLLGGSWDIESFVMQTSYLQLTMIVAALVFAFAGLVYYRSQTPGMALTDNKLVTSGGYPPSLAQSVARVLLTPIAPLSALVSLLNRSNRTLIDYLTGLRMIEKGGVGEKVTFDAGRIFSWVIRVVGPVALALSGIYFLSAESDQPNSEKFLDAVFYTGIFAGSTALFMAGVLTRLTRCRLTPYGIQRSGLLGWRKKIIGFDDMKAAIFKPGRLTSYLVVHQTDNARFKIPLEHGQSRLVGDYLHAAGVRIEQ